MFEICILRMLLSVYNGMQTATTSQRGPVIKQSDYGMCKAGNVFVFSLAIEVWFYHWQCLLMGDIWLLAMKMEPSWCGICPADVVFHHYQAIALVCGHLPSGGLSILYFFCVHYIIIWILISSTRMDSTKLKRPCEQIHLISKLD